MKYVLTDWEQFEKDCDELERNGILADASQTKELVLPCWKSHLIYCHNKKDFIVQITDVAVTTGCLCTEMKFLGDDEIFQKKPFRYI